jgi:exonuclease SbcD
MAFKFIQTSDWHLGVKLTSLPDNLADLRRSSAIRAINQMIAGIAREAPDAIILPGDLYDNHKPSSAIKNLFLSLMQNLPSSAKVYIVPGTHDYYHQGGLWDDPEFADFSIFKQDGFSFFDHPGSDIRFWGVPVLKGDRDKNWFHHLPEFENGKKNVLLYHGDFRDSGREFDEWDYPFGLADIANSGFDYIACGHHHKSRLIESDGRVIAAYSGSPCGWSFRKSELGARHYIVGNISDEEIRITYRDVPGPMIHNFEIDLSRIQGSGSILESMKNLDQNDFIRIIIDGSEDPMNIKSEIEKLLTRYVNLVMVDKSDFTPGFRSSDNVHLASLIKVLDSMLNDGGISGEFHARLVKRAKLLFS